AGRGQLTEATPNLGKHAKSFGTACVPAIVTASKINNALVRDQFPAALDKGGENDDCSIRHNCRPAWSRRNAEIHQRTSRAQRETLGRCAWRARGLSCHSINKQPGGADLGSFQHQRREGSPLLLLLGGLFGRLLALAPERRAEDVAERRARVGGAVLGNGLLLLGDFERLDRDLHLVAAAVELGHARVDLLADREAFRPLLAAVAREFVALDEGREVGADEL